MSVHQKIAGCVLAASSLALLTGTASAAVVGYSPSFDLSNQSYTVDLDGSTSYTFSKSTQSGGFGTNLAGVKTTGSAMVASSGPPFSADFRPSAYFTDSTRAPFIDQTLPATFKGYSATTAIPFSQTDSFIALQFSLQDGIHYGFARLAGLTLFDFAYETVAGKGIQAAPGPYTSPAPVPLPAGFSLMMAALGGLGLLKRKSKAA